MATAPPRLHFDDGSRVMTENEAVITSANTSNRGPSNPRGETPLERYYEIERISTQIVAEIIPVCINREDGFCCKVALQFPDELLPDASEVAWLIEYSIEEKHASKNDKEEESNSGFPLVFVLGDTTYASCCPDEIGAHHLSADVIVHFGQYACLSLSETLPVIYCFGVQEWNGYEKCCTAIMNQIKETKECLDDEKVILVCERRYNHNLEKLAETMKQNGLENVLVGSIPVSKILGARSQRTQICGQNKNEDCCRGDRCDAPEEETSANNEVDSISVDVHEEVSTTPDGCIIGGLHVPILQFELSQYYLIYIGDDSGDAKSRQFLNTLLKCTSPESETKACWSYNPLTEQLSTDPISNLGVSRFLNRRFFLTEKAKMANVIGILVGTLSQDRFRSVIASVRRKIEESGRSCYTFVVGKINVAKLANFAEVECFVLIACGETSVLRDEREFHVPVITPTELEISLGEKVWGGSASCNTNFEDFLKNVEEEGSTEGTNSTSMRLDNIKVGSGDEEQSGDEDSEDDEPFYSMISGTYISKPVSLKSQKQKQQDMNDANLEEKPGKGQMTEYKSAASEFWKKREYKGLEAQIGKDEAMAATKGQTGIASDYGK